MKRRTKIVLLVLISVIFIACLAYTLYPWMYSLYLSFHQHAQYQEFLEIVETCPKDPEETTTEVTSCPAPETETVPAPTAASLLYPALLVDSEEYNQRIFSEKQEKLSKPADYERVIFDLADYGLSTDVFAVLNIPALNLEMPIYLGASRANLAKGAAQLTETSLPIGGENTNCVLAGHRGWKGAAYFRDVPYLDKGETVTITNLWGTLTYEVQKVMVIDASDIDSVLIQPGKDLLSLLTCEYEGNGIKNRYLIICERVAG